MPPSYDMATKADLTDWIVEALRAKGGAAHHVQVARHVWMHHAAELKDSGDLLYTWQYDLRWAALRLRRSGVMRPDEETRRGEWALIEHGSPGEPG
jgi:hypothetical protein